MKKTPFRLIINAYDTEFSVHIAETQAELEACFALRARYFVKTDGSSVVDRDEYDEYSCHLVVTDTATEQVVGTYRLMRYDVAKANIGYYTETEFDLTNIKRQDFKLVELGRLCTAYEYRTKNIVGMLWNGIYEYLDHYGLEYLSGIVSLFADGSDTTSKIWAYAKYKNMISPPDLRVQPLPDCIDKTFDPNYVIDDVVVLRKQLPKIFLSYLVLDTMICGPSGHDDTLNLNDFYILSCLKDRKNNRRISRFKYNKV